MTLSFFLDLELLEGDMDDMVVTEASAFQNSYWKADEDGKMVLQRGARRIYR